MSVPSLPHKEPTEAEARANAAKLRAIEGALSIYEQGQNDEVGVTAEGTLAVIAGFLSGELPLGEDVT